MSGRCLRVALRRRLHAGSRQDELTHALKVVANGFIAHPHDADATACQMLRPNGVCSRALWPIVDPAIDLDSEPSARTVEVDDVGTDPELTPEA